MDEIIEVDEPLTEEDLMEMATEHFNNTVSYGAHRIDSNDEQIDIDAEEEEESDE
jgi:hypothetical protein